MLKTTKKVKHALVLPCICSIVFYMGSQVVTHTEAAFSKQQPVTVALSAASVFPETIEELVGKAEEHGKVISHHYNEIKSTVNTNGTVVEMEEKLSVWKQKREIIQMELTALHTVYTEVEAYYNKALEDVTNSEEPSAKDVLKYVQAGFEKVQHMNSSMNGESILQVIDVYITALEKEIEETKKKSLEQSEQVKQQEELKQSEQPAQVEQPTESKQSEQLTNPKQLEEPTQPEEPKQSEEAQ